MGALLTRSRLRGGHSACPGAAAADLAAQAYIEANDPAMNKRAIAHLNDALRTEDKEPGPGRWRPRTERQSDGHGGFGAGRRRSLGRQEKVAQQQANRAKALLPKNSAAYNRAENIHRQAERETTEKTSINNPIQS
jgi:hypothetical protein